MNDVSVITINYNNGDGLSQTIDSVLRQEVANLEYIVVDGGSNDNSKTVIENNSDRLSFWVSEPDRGIYDAMNKGIAKATHKYLLFLNSGDVFVANDSIRSLLAESEDKDIVFGDLIVNDGGKTVTKTYPDMLTFNHFRNDALPHPATLIKRGLFVSLGYYRTDLKIVSDWAFFMNAICLGRATYKHVNKEIAVFSLDGMSSLESNRLAQIKERDWVLSEYYGAFIPDYLTYERIQGELRRAANEGALAAIKKALSRRFKVGQ